MYLAVTGILTVQRVQGKHLKTSLWSQSTGVVFVNALLLFSSLSKISNKLSAGNSSKAFPVGVKHFIDSN